VNKFDNLAMEDFHHITKFNVESNEYAVLTGFDERALYAKYYKGLAPRVKDGLVFTGRPTTLRALPTQAQDLDLRFWERRDEDRTKEKSASATSNKPTASSSSSHSSSRPSTSQPQQVSRGTTPPKKPDLSKILGTDGKLLPEERECRKKHGLCIVCGSNKHLVDACPSRKSQARAAQLDDVPEDQSDGSASEAESTDSPK